MGRANKDAANVNDVSAASTIKTITAESITLAAGAAGTTGVVSINYAPIYDSAGLYVGRIDHSSFSFTTGTILTTEVEWDNQKDQTEFLASLNNGEFAIDYITGALYYCKATSGTSDSINYKTRQMNTDASFSGDIDVNAFKDTSGTEMDAWVFDDGEDISSVSEKWQGFAGYDEDDDKVYALRVKGGKLVLYSTTTATSSNRVEEIDPLSQQYVALDLVDTTNVAAATNYYPSSTGRSLDGYKDLSLSGEFVDADNTVTMTVEVTCDEDATNANWVQVYGYDNNSDTNVNQITVTNGTVDYALSFENAGSFKYFRVKIVTGGATNTIICKGKLKAL